METVEISFYNIINSIGAMMQHFTECIESVLNCIYVNDLLLLFILLPLVPVAITLFKRLINIS